jgi:hypothetical protein
MTVLNPNGRIAGVSVEGLSIELGGESPLPRVSGTVGKRHKALLPPPPTEPPQVNDAIQCHFTPEQIAGPVPLARSPTPVDAEEPHGGLPPSTRSVWFRRRRGFDAECSNRGLSDLPSRGQRALKPHDFGL